MLTQAINNAFKNALLTKLSYGIVIQYQKRRSVFNTTTYN